MAVNADRESLELERAYPGILARLDAEPLDRLAREFRLSKSALFHARERMRKLRSIEHTGVRAPKVEPARPTLKPEATIPQVAAPARPVHVKDPDLQAGLEQAYPGITTSLSRRDDVEVAVQFGISLPAIARIREVLGVERSEAPSHVVHATASRALPARLVAARD